MLSLTQHGVFNRVTFPTRGSPGNLQLFDKIEEVEYMGKLEPIFSSLKDLWKDLDDSWIYVMDTDSDGNVNIVQDFQAAGLC